MVAKTVINFSTGLQDTVMPVMDTINGISGSITITKASPVFAQYLLDDYIEAEERVITYGPCTAYDKDYQAFFFNNGNRRYKVVLEGGTNFYIFPGQTARVKNMGGFCWANECSKIWVIPAPIDTVDPVTALTLYVDHSNGSAEYDGLTTVSPFPTIYYAQKYVEKYLDAYQQGITIQVLSTEFTEGTVSFTKTIRGVHIDSLKGNVQHPELCIWNIPYGQTAITCRDWTGTDIQGFTMRAVQASNLSINVVTNVITAPAGHGFVENDGLEFEGSPLPVGIAASTTYYVVASNLTDTTFSVSATQGGPVLALGTTGTSVRAGARYCTGISVSQHGIIDVGAGGTRNNPNPANNYISMRFGWMPSGTLLDSTNGGSLGFNTNTQFEVYDNCYAIMRCTIMGSTMLMSAVSLWLTGTLTITQTLYMLGGSVTMSDVTFPGTGTVSGFQYNIAGNALVISGGTVLPGVGASSSLGAQYI